MQTNITEHAVQRYVERVGAASEDSIRKWLTEALRVAKSRQGRGQDMRCKRWRSNGGEPKLHFYIKHMSHKNTRVFLAVDEKLTCVFTVLTLDMYKNLSKTTFDDWRPAERRKSSKKVV